MRRVFIHAGFHKTGTTTAQAFLHANRKVIWPRYALVLPGRIAEVTRAATFHSATGDPLSLSEFRFRLQEFLETLSLGEKRGICLSAEDLTGLRPASGNANGYKSAPVLMKATVDTFRAVFGDDTQITVYLSTRTPQHWLRSLWAHLLVKTRLRSDFPTFAAEMAGQADLDQVVEAVRRQLGPGIVKTARLEDLRDMRFGPAAPFVEFLDLPPWLSGKLVDVAPANASPSPAVCAELLALNRGPLDDDALLQVKAGLTTQGMTGRQSPAKGFDD